jgi:hypothetical protein
MGKKSGSGSGMNNPDHISDFWVKILKFLMRIRDGKKFGSGMGKIRIRDDNPGSASLSKSRRPTGLRIKCPKWQNTTKNNHLE